MSKGNKSVKFTCGCGKTVRVARGSECQRASKCWVCVENMSVRERKAIYVD